MSGRRSHARFAVLQSPEGVLRVLQDIIVHDTLADHTIAVGREPGILGEAVTVEFPMEAADTISAHVVESQPLVVDGTVRHQLRLQHKNAPGTFHAPESGSVAGQ